MYNKALSRVEIKDAAKGEVEAVFSTFGVIDHDGDVTDPGAFQHGAKVLISAYNHQSWGGALPVGKGRIEVGPQGAVLKGQFFMNTQQGRDTFETVKALSEEGLGEWSYGFDVEESEDGQHEGKSARVLKKLKVYEVSPVLRGAGVGTTTLTVKSGSDLEELLKASGYSKPKPKKPKDDDEGEKDPKKKPSDDDEDDEEEDEDDEKKPRRGKKPPPKSLNSEISLAVGAVRDAIESAERVVALRAENGKSLSKVNVESLDELRQTVKRLETLLNVKEDNSATQAEFLRYVAFNLGDRNE